MIIPLYEIRLTVETDRVIAQKYKYPVTFTGKNYIPQRVTDDLEKEGYSLRLHTRVPVDHIMKMERTSMWDKPDHVGRSIYFLEGQEEAALKLVRADMDETLKRMMERINQLYHTWVTRNDEKPMMKGNRESLA